jgi:hypothetical protein
LSDYRPHEDPVTLADLAQPQESTVRAPRAHTVLFSLLGAGVVVAALVVGIGWAVGAIAHTETGFCGHGGAPCTSLSLERVEELAVVDLPEASEVSDVYFQRDLTGATFRATVTLPPGDESEIVAGVPAVESVAEGRRTITFDYEWSQ